MNLESLVTNAGLFAEQQRRTGESDPIFVSHVRRGELSSTALALIRPGGGLRPHYHANYYAAFVIGPDGHNIEVVCHAPAA